MYILGMQSSWFLHFTWLDSAFEFAVGCTYAYILVQWLLAIQEKHTLYSVLWLLSDYDLWVTVNMVSICMLKKKKWSATFWMPWKWDWLSLHCNPCSLIWAFEWCTYCFCMYIRFWERKGKLRIYKHCGLTAALYVM